MSHLAPSKQETSVTRPSRMIQTNNVDSLLYLPSGRRIITCAWHSIRVWDLETGTQVRKAWQDGQSKGAQTIALSPDGKKLTSGRNFDGVVRLWDVDTGKVIPRWIGHTTTVRSLSWSRNGRRVVSGSGDATFRVWDVESGKTILGPISTSAFGISYSPDGTMIATGDDVYDANTGELLKRLKFDINASVTCVAWTSDGKSIIVGSLGKIKKFDTVTWAEIAVFEIQNGSFVKEISISPNNHILASASSEWKVLVRLWNLETNQPIIQPLLRDKDGHNFAKSVAFSADGKSLSAGGLCTYTWDFSAIVREAGLSDLPSEHVNTDNKPVFDLRADATPRRPREAPQIAGAPSRRIPSGFFDEIPRHVDSSTSRTHRTLLGRLPTFLHRRHAKPHRATGRDTQPQRRPLSLPRNLVSGMLRRRQGSDIQLREPPIVEVPCTAGKPRNYHARKKRAASSSRFPNTHTTQQHSAIQGTPSSSQLPPPSATGAAGTTGTNLNPHITITDAGWRARFMVWVCCMPIQNTDGH